MIIVLGSPRSGTTWLGKAFSSHPETLYLHEPDIVDRGDDLLPYWFADDARGFEGRANKYLSRLASNRNLRVMGVPPFFNKAYRSNIETKIYASIIYAAKALEKTLGQSVTDRIQIPDLIRPGFEPKIVIKSVGALGRLDAFQKSGIEISPVLLLRHPCAYIHSYLRGLSKGLMPPPRPLTKMLVTRSAKRLDAEAHSKNPTTVLETLAWTWLLSNCEAHAAISKTGGTVVIFEDLVSGGDAAMRALYLKLGLSWSGQTTEYIREFSKNDGRYFSIRRYPATAINRWKFEMHSEHIERVRNIVCRDPIGQQFFS
jgi:hypothetical protein